MRVRPGAVRLVIVVLLVGLFAYFYFAMAGRVLKPYGWGAVALLFFWMVIWLLTGKLNPFLLVIGEDGRPSTSKLKPFLWTIVMIFAYAVFLEPRLAESIFRRLNLRSVVKKTQVGRDVTEKSIV